MKPTLLLTLLPLVFSTPQLLAKSDLEILRARCAEQERQIRELEDENAKLRSLQGTAVKAAKVKTVAAAPATSGDHTPALGGPAATSYVVRRGDSWDRIAGKFGTQPAALASLNGLPETSMIHPGQQLKVPGTSRTGTAVATTAPAPKSTPVPKSTPDVPTPAGKTHQVKQGETFYSIAKKYGVSTASLIAANPNLKPAAIRPGQVVQLTQSNATPPPAVAAAPKTTTTPAPTPKPTPKPATPAAPLAATARTTTPVSTHAAAAPVRATATAATSSPAADKSRIKSVMIDGKTTFGEFATQHGTNVGHLNDLNALDLVDTTVLAKGSELYVPVQP